MDVYELKQKLDKITPFAVLDYLSKDGVFDNSDVICYGKADNILFTLDLTEQAIKRAIELNCGIIVTHHPAIFNPVYNVTGALWQAINNGIGVVSIHLVADYAPKGVDYYLSKALGATDDADVLEKYGQFGYGRKFNVKSQTLFNYAQSVKKVLNCKNLSVFGDENKTISSVASFCGAGLNEKSLELAGNVDVIVSADIKHHILVQAMQKGVAIIMPTHYSSENYGFKKISEDFSKTVKEKVYYLEEQTLN